MEKLIRFNLNGNGQGPITSLPQQVAYELDVSIDTVILDRMGGALANAIYDACGARLYQMPMTPER